jgi:hypothetical protein
MGRGKRPRGSANPEASPASGASPTSESNSNTRKESALLKAIGKLVLGILGIGAGLFVAMAASGLAGDGMGEVLGGAEASDEKNAGFRKAGS